MPRDQALLFRITSKRDSDKSVSQILLRQHQQTVCMNPLLFHQNACIYQGFEAMLDGTAMAEHHVFLPNRLESTVFTH